MFHILITNNERRYLKLYVPIANIFFRPEKTELDYDTGIIMRLWNVKTVVLLF
jgi:hypothetical protein